MIASKPDRKLIFLNMTPARCGYARSGFDAARFEPFKERNWK